MLSSKLKLLVSVLTISLLSTTLSSQTIIRVNCGGPDYWDSERNLWQADQPYSPGSWGYENPGYMLFTDYPVDGTNDDPLYQWEHNALDNYKFTVPNGTYVVTMKFADLYYDNIGDRIFHVEIEGNRVLHNFDIIAEVGFASACDKTFIINVTDGVMDFLFITIETEPGVTIAHANIKAISIVEQGTHEPKLWIDPKEIDLFDFSYRRSFKIKNGGELPLTWSCAENPDETWITEVSPTSGMLYQGQSQFVEVSVTRAGIADGNYEGNISVTSNGGNENVKVLMQVLTKAPSLLVQPTKISYGAILTQTTFNVKNVGTADLDWAAKNKNDDPWIKSISPVNGRIEPGKIQEILVTTDRANLPKGVFEGFVAITSNGGSENVAVKLDNNEKPLSVNCGGGEYLDPSQQGWLNDVGFIGGQTLYSNAEIHNTENDKLYQDARVGMTKYQFAVQKNGYYQVVLHFAELQHDAAGKRLFDVKIEDSLILQNFDMFAEHGKYYAVIQSATIHVNDQQLDIAFIKKTGEPCIAGIEIHQIPFLQVESPALNFASILTQRNFIIKNAGTLELNWSAKNLNNEPWLKAISPSSGVLTPGASQLVNIVIDRTNFADSSYHGTVSMETDGGNQNVALAFETKNKPLRINCGGSEYQDQHNNPWLDDMLFIGGKLMSCQNDILNTNDDRLYQSVRSGMTKYEFPVQQNGLYKVTMHFAEIQNQSIGKRIFDMKIENQVVLENFDIFAQAGSFSALIKSARIEVTDNQLDFTFVSKTGEPCISAIEVYLSPVVALEPMAIKFGSLLTRRTFSIINAGVVDLNWKAMNKNNEPWLKQISPKAGVLAPSASHLVSVTIDRAELTDSLYQGAIAIETDGGDQTVTLALETKNQPLRINCGGAEYWDEKNNLWFDDIGSSGGKMIACQEEIANTNNDGLYQTARVGAATYEFPLQHSGLYGFKMYFAEFQHQTAGARVFDVVIENSVVLRDFDIYAETGSLSAIIKSGRVEVNDHQLDIAFIATAGEPIISAIEIYQSPLLAVAPTSLPFGSILTQRTVSIANAGAADMNWSVKPQGNLAWLKQVAPMSGVLAPTETQLINITIDRAELTDSLYQAAITIETNENDQAINLALETKHKPLRVNCGGAEFVDANHQLWFDDLLFQGGHQVGCSENIANTSDDQLYQTARLGVTNYAFPVQKNGLYGFSLHFAELQHQAAGARVFDVLIENQLVLKDFDIFAEAGSLSAIVKSGKIEVDDNQMDVAFVAKAGEPMISAIEIYQSPLLSVAPTSLKFGSMLTRRTFAIVNSGSIDMNWSVKGQNNQTWLKQITPIGGVLTPSDTQRVTVTIDRAELADSLVFEGSLQVETDGGNQQISLHLATTDEPLRINCGGTEMLDANQDYWFDDLFAIGGHSITTQQSIGRTENEKLYQAARTGIIKYELPIQTNGLYEIALHFAEIEHQTIGQRIFDVQIEDSLILNDFDIYVESGSLNALVKKATVKVIDNQLDIIFLSKTGEPCIAGIQVAATTPELPSWVGRSDDQRLTPTCFQLDQNYPNPFNLETRIAFQLPVAARVTLEVYNLLGQKQQTLVNNEMTAGFHAINWDGRDLNGVAVTSGFYLYKIQITPKDGQMTSFQQVRKMLLLK